VRKLWFALAGLLLTVAAAPAQDFPQRPIHMIIAFGPGGGSDIIGRILADSMQAKLSSSKISRAPAAFWATTTSRAPRPTATRSAS
jgi:tripartite-type tricarboxylate transporter receptor subunit TctC